MDRPPPGWIPPLGTTARLDRAPLRVWPGRRVWLWLLLVVLAAGLVAAVRFDGNSMCGCSPFHSTVPPMTRPG
jgi:integral membrane sensor domain MASE1